MSKVTINGIEYEVLGTVNTGKREYIFVVNGSKVEFFKKVGDQYIAPNKDLTLEGNAGGSLTELNENVLLSHVRDLIERDYIN